MIDKWLTCESCGTSKKHCDDTKAFIYYASAGPCCADCDHSPAASSVGLAVAETEKRIVEYIREDARTRPLAHRWILAEQIESGEYRKANA